MQFRNYNRIKIWIFLLLIIISISQYYSSEKTMDPYFSEQWGLYQEDGIDINAVDMWEYIEELNLNESDEIIVAIIDSGIDYNHEDLKDSIWKNDNEIVDGIDNDHNGYIDDVYGWDFCNSIGIYATDDHDLSIGRHGTACAGIIAAQHNKVGISGIINNNDHIKLMSLKVLDDSSGQGDIDDVISAIQYADAMGAVLCNLSFSTKKFSEKLMQTIEESNMLFVVSSGNHFPFSLNIDKENAYIYPACFDCDNIIVTASIDQNGEISDFSNYGKEMVDIAAPGERILTTTPHNTYTFMDGTSLAAPYVTGVASLLFYEHQEATAIDIKAILMNSANEIGGLDGKVGGNRVLNAYQAVFNKEIDFK